MIPLAVFACMGLLTAYTTVDLTFHGGPLAAAFDLHGLSTSHEWLATHFRGGGEGAAVLGLSCSSLSASGLIPPLVAQPRHPSASDFYSFSFCHRSRDVINAAAMQIPNLPPGLSELCSDPSNCSKEEAR